MAIKQTAEAEQSGSVPAWVMDLTSQYALMFGLGGWDISVFLHDSPGENGNADGVTYLEHTRYRMATLVFRRGMIEEGQTERARRVILHEVMHIHLSRVNMFVENLLKRLGDDEEQSYFMDLYSQAEEETIETTVRALEPYIVERNALVSALKDAVKQKKADNKLIKELQSNEKPETVNEPKKPRRKTFTTKRR
jgi:hypothetical protein